MQEPWPKLHVESPSHTFTTLTWHIGRIAPVALGKEFSTSPRVTKDKKEGHLPPPTMSVSLAPHHRGKIPLPSLPLLVNQPTVHYTPTTIVHTGGLPAELHNHCPGVPHAVKSPLLNSIDVPGFGALLREGRADLRPPSAQSLNSTAVTFPHNTTPLQLATCILK
jgi:hypothetical protein